MQKVACLFSFEQSSWVSCQKIVFNLHQAYQKVPGLKLENFNFSMDMDSEALLKLAHEIREHDPDIISFMDHRPHPYFLLTHLLPLFDGKRPKLLFHVFGDFTLNYHFWDKLGGQLQDWPVKFFVASPRQKLLIDRMFSQNESVICHFPVRDDEFYFDSKGRLEQRNKWGLQDEDIVYAFTGRLSRQKRIKTLIQTFAKEFEKDPRAYLYIYGNPDNIGDPFLHLRELEGEYFRKIFRRYREFSPELQKRIRFFGAVPNSELKGVYQGADVLVNLSVHNDEDYGMSVAEAQATGLSCVLTDWGGLAGFSHPTMPEATRFVSVRITKRQKTVSASEARQHLRALFQPTKQEERQKLARLSQEKFGTKSAAVILEKTVNETFETFGGFTPLFKEVALRSAHQEHFPIYLDKRFNLNRLYKDIYSAYVRQD